MAFHVACPITRRRICYCELGFTKKPGFLHEISKLEVFLQDPWVLRPQVESATTTIQVEVPRLELSQLAGPPGSPILEEPEPMGVGIRGEVSVGAIGGGSRSKEESAWAQSVRAKRLELQRQAAEASVAAEDYVRRLEAGAAAVEAAGEAASNAGIEESSIPAVKIICRICFSGEEEGSTKANKMVPCKTCNKKYHRSCLKVWAEYRDLFHWNSWSCPSCRNCEVCKRTGDPTKFKFCKRCDGAYHCYCQQPPHKNVSHGPFLCPKHTRCHSCASTVPGSGVSTRWFLSYTNCDACGRLFVKGKYCPVCLKVYRDSEMTPMVCCDICQQWVHCVCDGISDEKYRQFESDRNLHYKCPPCRGECYKVKDVEDAVRELWRRRDNSDKRLIASLRAAAGLPTEASTYPYSDEEEKTPVVSKSEPGRTLKFSVKSITDSITKKTKEDAMKSPTKKSSKSSTKKVEILTANSDAGRVGSNGDTGKSVEKDGIVQPSMPRKLHIKGSTGKKTVESDSTKGTKLVIHLGTKNKKLNSPPRSETPAQQRQTESLPIIIDNKANKASSSSKTSEKPSKSKIKFTSSELPSAKEPSTSNDSRPLLKLKFKNPYFDQKNSWASTGPKEVEEEKTPVVKGQRSKRKRPSSSSGRFEVAREEETSQGTSEPSSDVADAGWILKKLGRDAIGKRVEVHESVMNSWQKGMVSDVKDGTSSLSVRLDNGKSKTLELGKQKIRFVSLKRSKK
ncbi:Histone-lysine N-methyltransferase 2B [Rhynchospora pubera]|uniref:Histone-lysine N-methyltransferase 2B n=1 Tax=Rhynchospora pubera TaxID=906938 RepID=A0AAV8HBJ1_9POAL|nr:Histone-lysine N-methyltransferase 2B [Rhynchospora pubera]